MRTNLSKFKAWLLTLTILPCVSTVEACDYGANPCYDAPTGIEAEPNQATCLDNYAAICNDGDFEVIEVCDDICERGECVKRNKR